MMRLDAMSLLIYLEVTKAKWRLIVGRQLNLMPMSHSYQPHYTDHIQDKHYQ